MNRVKVLREKEIVHSRKARDSPNHDGKSANPGERGQELKASQQGYNQGKNQCINPKYQVVLLKASKTSQGGDC